MIMEQQIYISPIPTFFMLQLKEALKEVGQRKSVISGLVCEVKLSSFKTSRKSDGE